jgi:hypothetical protein
MQAIAGGGSHHARPSQIDDFTAVGRFGHRKANPDVAEATSQVRVKKAGVIMKAEMGILFSQVYEPRQNKQRYGTRPSRSSWYPSPVWRPSVQ